jgi:hypothetical protein
MYRCFSLAKLGIDACFWITETGIPQWHSYNNVKTDAMYFGSHPHQLLHSACAVNQCIHRLHQKRAPAQDAVINVSANACWEDKGPVGVMENEPTQHILAKQPPEL